MCSKHTTEAYMRPQPNARSFATHSHTHTHTRPAALPSAARAQLQNTVWVTWARIARRGLPDHGMTQSDAAVHNAPGAGTALGLAFACALLLASAMLAASTTPGLGVLTSAGAGGRFVLSALDLAAIPHEPNGDGYRVVWCYSNNATLATPHHHHARAHTHTPPPPPPPHQNNKSDPVHTVRTSDFTHRTPVNRHQLRVHAAEQRLGWRQMRAWRHGFSTKGEQAREQTRELTPLFGYLGRFLDNPFGGVFFHRWYFGCTWWVAFVGCGGGWRRWHHGLAWRCCCGGGRGGGRDGGVEGGRRAW